MSKSPVKVEVGEGKKEEKKKKEEPLEEGACPQKEVIKEIKNEKTNKTKYKTIYEIITY